MVHEKNSQIFPMTSFKCFLKIMTRGRESTRETEINHENGLFFFGVGGGGVVLWYENSFIIAFEISPE